MVIDGSQVALDYSRPGAASHNPKQHQQHQHQQQQHQTPTEFKDWICPQVCFFYFSLFLFTLSTQCGGNNFARRNACYQCQAPKPEHPQTVTVPNINAELENAYYNNSGGADVIINTSPTHVLIIRGLDLATTEQTVCS